MQFPPSYSSDLRNKCLETFFEDNVTSPRYQGKIASST